MGVVPEAPQQQAAGDCPLAAAPAAAQLTGSQLRKTLPQQTLGLLVRAAGAVLRGPRQVLAGPSAKRGRTRPARPRQDPAYSGRASAAAATARASRRAARVRIAARETRRDAAAHCAAVGDGWGGVVGTERQRKDSTQSGAAPRRLRKAAGNVRAANAAACETRHLQLAQLMPNPARSFYSP